MFYTIDDYNLQIAATRNALDNAKAETETLKEMVKDFRDYWQAKVDDAEELLETIEDLVLIEEE